MAAAIYSHYTNVSDFFLPGDPKYKDRDFVFNVENGKIEPSYLRLQITLTLVGLLHLRVSGCVACLCVCTCAHTCVSV